MFNSKRIHSLEERVSYLEMQLIVTQNAVAPAKGPKKKLSEKEKKARKKEYMKHVVSE